MYLQRGLNSRSPTYKDGACNSNLYCSWDDDKCRFSLNDTMIIDFVNRVIEEFALNSIQFKELIQDGNYFDQYYF